LTSEEEGSKGVGKAGVQATEQPGLEWIRKKGPCPLGEFPIKKCNRGDHMSTKTLHTSSPPAGHIRKKCVTKKKEVLEVEGKTQKNKPNQGSKEGGKKKKGSPDFVRGGPASRPSSPPRKSEKAQLKEGSSKTFLGRQRENRETRT